MRRIIILLLLLPFVGAEGLIEGEFTVTYNDSGNVSTALVNMSAPFSFDISCPEADSIIVQEQPCDNLSITGAPLTIESGEKISYAFSPWQDGDEVTYWIEDARGDTIKKPYTTTSKSKKSYTPSFEEGEKGLIFKAERTREGCAIAQASTAVIVLGEGGVVACEEPIVENCTDDTSVTSLYIRAKNWQENITLYGNVAQSGEYWLFGEESPRSLMMEAGTFSTAIYPAKGNNTYGLVPANHPRTVTFDLAFDEPEPVVEEPVENLNGSFVIPATGNVIVENDTQQNVGILLGIMGVLGGSLAFSRLKTKSLRRKQGSVKTHGKRKKARKEGDQGKVRGRLVAC